MDKLDSMVDLVRALAKKCEDLDTYKNSSEMYERWYREQRDENRRLREKLEEAGITY
jgi:hypothetical protein